MIVILFILMMNNQMKIILIKKFNYESNQLNSWNNNIHLKEENSEFLK